MSLPLLFADDGGSQLLRGIFTVPLLQLLVAFIFAFLFPITSAAIINYLERKIMAWMQNRQGPLHTDPQGSLQLVADVGKMLLKEDVHPAHSDKLVFLLASSVFIVLLSSHKCF